MINFQWFLNGDCNYRCPYCLNSAKWAQLNLKNTLYLSIKEWGEIWGNIHDKYGAVDISIVGGEPSLYPYFDDLVNELSRRHRVCFRTNLSFDAKMFLSKVRRENIWINATFHPLFAKLEEFVEKALVLKDSGLLNDVSYIGYPPQMKQATYYQSEFKKRGLSLKIQPFWGEYDNRIYPEQYDEDEKKIIGPVLENQSQAIWLTRNTNTGKICKAGQLHAVIENNGLVKRCEYSREAPLGNISDKNFKLSDTPLPCMYIYCPESGCSHPIDKNRLIDSDAKNKVALVISPGWGRGSPPYVLALLSGVLRQNKYPVYTFDINNRLYHLASEKDKLLWRWEESFFWQKELSVEKYISENSGHIDNIINEILATGARIICFSVYSTTRLMSLEIARRIKAKDKNIYIVFGGSECKKILNGWRYFIGQDCVDVVVFEEGEEALPEVIRMITEGQDLSKCKGIAYKTDNEVIDFPQRQLMDNLDDLPFADFSDFDFNLYEGHNPAVIPILTSRGCTEHCVYCSTKRATEGFRTMSGKRIFAEIMHQINAYKQKTGPEQPVFIFFLDLLINANLEILEEWVGLLAQERERNKDLEDLRWHAQIILNNRLTPGLLEKAKLSGCVLLNYGVESGSQKVLKDMGKHVNMEIMEDSIRNIYEAGIPARGNFMFGFPTETEEDFMETLFFVQRNGKYMQEIYPSRTFCALEHLSVLSEHKEKFGITVPFPGGENLFWESQDGKNNYLIRLKRYERFCEFVYSLPHNPLITGIADVKRDNYLCLGEYYRFSKQYDNAVDCYEKYLSLGGTDKRVRENIDLCKKEKEEHKTRVNPSSEEAIVVNDVDIENNLRLNDREYAEKKLVLQSVPPDIFFQIDGPCNQECIFCSRPEKYEYFSLNNYYDNLKEKLHPIFSKATNIHLTGAGEFLLLPEAEKILDYFNNEFPHTKKIFSTNGSTLTPKIIDILVKNRTQYSITISLPAANAELHKKLTKSDNFERIMENVRHLCASRDDWNRPRIFFMFLITQLNIEDLTNVIKIAADLKVDSLSCEYVSVYKLEQKNLSCFWNKESTNAIFDEAQKLANKLNVHLSLPWRFNQNCYPKVICKDPWKQIMINSKGEVLPCCLFGDFKESLFSKDFREIWNGDVYQRIRGCLIGRMEGYCDYCLREKPATINDFASHIIIRGKTEEEIRTISGDKPKEDKPVLDLKVSELTRNLPPPNKVFFNWDIHYSCNYRCSYCFFQGKWEEVAKGNIYPDIKTWVGIWERLYNKYGECDIDISGGEPTTYPHFFDLINQISRMHRVRFNTNLSFDIPEFFRKIDLSQITNGWDRIKVNSSLHPEHASSGEFLGKLKQIKDAGFKAIVTYVAYPPHLKPMHDIKAEFVKNGIDFIIQPFRGKYQGLNYPDAYTQEEREILNKCSPGNPAELFAHHLKKEKAGEKRLCRMGQVYAKIYPNGEAHRCCADGVGRIGNVINDKDFSLLSEPAYCRVICPCWKAMIADKESEWLHLWKE